LVSRRHCVHVGRSKRIDDASIRAVEREEQYLRGRIHLDRPRGVGVKGAHFTRVNFEGDGGDGESAMGAVLDHDLFLTWRHENLASDKSADIHASAPIQQHHLTPLERGNFDIFTVDLCLANSGLET
jgi:hypothetical protein